MIIDLQNDNRYFVKKINNTKAVDAFIYFDITISMMT